MISVIIPAYNEENCLWKTVTEVKSLENLLEIIIIDDGSIDDTSLAIQEDPMVKGFRKVKSQGKGAAIKTGFKMVSPKANYVLVIDADSQIKVNELRTFFRIMEFYDADVVVGSKKHDYSIVDYSIVRSILSAGYSFIIRILFGLSLKDTQCGFKLFKRSVLDVILSKITVKQFAFDLEVLVCCKENKIRVADAPVYVYKSEKSSVGSSDILGTFKDTLAVWWRKQKGWYR